MCITVEPARRTPLKSEHLDIAETSFGPRCLENADQQIGGSRTTMRKWAGNCM